MVGSRRDPQLLQPTARPRPATSASPAPAPRRRGGDHPLQHRRVPASGRLRRRLRRYRQTTSKSGRYPPAHRHAAISSRRRCASPWSRPPPASSVSLHPRWKRSPGVLAAAPAVAVPSTGRPRLGAPTTASALLGSCALDIRPNKATTTHLQSSRKAYAVYAAQLHRPHRHHPQPTPSQLRRLTSSPGRFMIYRTIALSTLCFSSSGEHSPGHPARHPLRKSGTCPHARRPSLLAGRSGITTASRRRCMPLADPQGAALSFLIRSITHRHDPCSSSPITATRPHARCARHPCLPTGSTGGMWAADSPRRPHLNRKESHGYIPPMTLRRQRHLGGISADALTRSLLVEDMIPTRRPRSRPPPRTRLTPNAGICPPGPQIPLHHSSHKLAIELTPKN